MTSDLLSAVDALTKPQTIKVPQGDRWTTIRHDPLLVQLEAAITSATTGNGGGRGSPSGVLVNSSALHRAEIITSQIRSWCVLVKVRPGRDAGRNLRTWYVAFNPTTNDHGWHTRTLEGWARDIRELLDPPKRVPLKGACPVCKVLKVTNDEGEVSAALEVQWDVHRPAASIRAVCRAECGAEWQGGEAIAELVEELNDTVVIPDET